MTGKKKKSGECKHAFVKYPPRIGKLKVCKKCGFLWVLGDVKFGEHSIKLSGAGNYIEANTTTAPASPTSGKIRLYATSGTSVKIKDSTGTETDLAAPGGDLYNLLTNPGFEIWQRGAGAFTASGAYTADQWYLSLAGTDTISVTKAGIGEADTIKDTDSRNSLKAVFTLGNGAGASAIRSQIMANTTDENAGYQLTGRTVTFRIRVRTSTASAVKAYVRAGPTPTTTQSSFHTGGGAFESLDVTVTLPSDLTYLDVGVTLHASATVYIDNATIVIGSTAQTYYPLHKADEWERCQRYYEWLPAADGGPGNFSLMYEMYADAARNVYWTQMFLTRKAVVPTVTKVGTWTVANAGQPGLSGAAASRTAFTLLLAASGVGFARAYGDSTDDGWTVEANP